MSVHNSFDIPELHLANFTGEPDVMAHQEMFEAEVGPFFFARALMGIVGHNQITRHEDPLAVAEAFEAGFVDMEAVRLPQDQQAPSGIPLPHVLGDCTATLCRDGDILTLGFQQPQRGRNGPTFDAQRYAEVPGTNGSLWELDRVWSQRRDGSLAVLYTRNSRATGSKLSHYRADWELARLLRQPVVATSRQLGKAAGTLELPALDAGGEVSRSLYAVKLTT